MTCSARRERLILENLAQVQLIARNIHERLPENIALEDLVSAGVIGLIAAIDHFDERQNVKLKTYAEYKIRGAILDSLRQSDWAPRLKRRRAKQIESAVAAAEQKLQRTPSEEEIAEELGVSLDEYRQYQVEVRALNLANQECGATREEKLPSTLLERRELERLLAAAVNTIPPIEHTVLDLYYDGELTLREIGAMVHLHESRISQIKSQAILRLRAQLSPRWPTSRSAAVA